MNKQAKTFIEISILFLIIIGLFGVFVLAQTGEPSLVRVIEEKDEAPIINFSSLDIVNRSMMSDTFYNPLDKRYISRVYPKPVNMKNLSGQYVPYEEVTELTFDGQDLILRWNNKEVRLEIYTKNKEDIKEKLKDKTAEEKKELNFKTNIQKGKGAYYFNHTLVEDKQKQPKGIGYEIHTKNVKCVVKNNGLKCDEQFIDFRQAISEQNFTIEFKNNNIEISGEDLSYIDPSITIDVEDGSGDWGEIEYDGSDYDWDDEDIDNIGSRDTPWITRGWIIFDIDTIDDSVLINDVDLYMYTQAIDTADCDDNDLDIRFYEMDKEDYDISPDNQAEMEDLWEGIGDDVFYGGISDLDSGNEDSPISKDLGYAALSETQSLIDGNPTDRFMIGIKAEPEDEDLDYDCNINFYDNDGGSNLPYIILTYTIPDAIAPTTSASATSPPGGSSYTFGTVTNNNVSITLSCSDGSGSGCKIGYPKYCIDTYNSCSPLTIYSSPINVSLGGVSYIRYYSKDNMNNSETVKSNTIKINRNYPKNVSLYVNSAQIWNYSDYFAETKTVNGFAQQLNNALASCTADSEGYCDIPITIHSDSAGKINITNINIYFNITEYLWNISALPALSTYKVRIKSTDGLLNSSWDESDGVFTIVSGNISDNPPTTTLISPINNSIDTDGVVTFNCSATDDKKLTNITLYGNWTGNWIANQTKSLTGTYNSTTFTKNLTNGVYKWNCLSYDNASQKDWGDSNRTIIVNISTQYCYQESANVSTVCGGLNTGKYVDSGNWDSSTGNVMKTYDGTWTTWGYPSGTAISYLGINYTKPSGALSTSILKVKDSVANTRNVSILQSCWNYNITTLMLKSEVRRNVPTGVYGVNWSCYNGTTWAFLSNGDGDSLLYEEAMWWDISS
jgi:hypothetical protein